MTHRWLVPLPLLLALALPHQAGEPKQPEKKDLPTFQVPYKLTDTQHVLVRVKINGKGPFNFIVDTGAPLLYVSIPIAKKLGLQEEKKLTVLDSLDIEGGARLTKVKAIVATPFQLEGMNALGVPGVELHGIMGYTVLAHYKMEFDFNKDKMAWTKLAFDPPPPKAIEGKDKEVDSLNALGPMIKAIALLLGKKTIPAPLPRGFLGIELEEGKDKLTVKSVLDKGPAAGKLKAGDLLLAIQGKEVAKLADAQAQTAQLTVGETVRLTVQRAGEKDKTDVILTAGEGL